MYRTLATLFVVFSAANAQALELYQPLATCTGTHSDIQVRILQSTSKNTRALVLIELNGGRLTAKADASIAFDGEGYPNVSSRSLGLSLLVTDEDPSYATVSVNGSKAELKCVLAN